MILFPTTEEKYLGERGDVKKIKRKTHMGYVRLCRLSECNNTLLLSIVALFVTSENLMQLQYFFRKMNCFATEDEIVLRSNQHS